MSPRAETIDSAALHNLADHLRTAEQTRRPIIPIINQQPGLTIADAYRIQTINIDRRITAGAALVGHKIGLTSKPMQQMLGVNEPDYGALLDELMLESGATVRAASFIAPRVEPELAFRLVEDLSGPDLTIDDVLMATAEIRPALEIIDSRIADWRISLIDTVADNASCAHGVLSTQAFAPGSIDLAKVEVELKVDGATVQHGAGAAVLGHPAIAVAWLASALAGYGDSLRAGQIVLSGSMTAAVPLLAGQTITADYGALGAVKLMVA